MQQESLWHDTLSDAIRSGVERAGGPKTIGHELWPEMDPADAGKKLMRCLSPSRDEKLSLEQVELILLRIREADCHIPTHYLANKLSYETPKPITRETAKELLQRQYIGAVQVLGEITKKMERLA